MINRRYRNRRIGDFLKELQLTEGRNTGLRKILRALEKNGSPLPEFETDEGRSYFITRLFIHPGFKVGIQDTTQDTPQVTAQDTAQDTPQVTPQVTPQEIRSEQTLKFCYVPRTRNEIQNHIGINDREYFRKSILKPLLDSKQLEMTIPDKPNSRNQKYVKAKKNSNGENVAP